MNLRLWFTERGWFAPRRRQSVPDGSVSPATQARIEESDRRWRESNERQNRTLSMLEELTAEIPVPVPDDDEENPCATD